MKQVQRPEIKVSRMWKERTKTVPATNAAFGTQLQKIILMSTACVIRKVLG